MKQIVLNTLKFLFFLSIGILLVWLSLRNIPDEKKADIIKAIREANYAWIALAMAVGIFAHISRAIRWKMLLAPLQLKPKLSNTFYAVMIGYLGNLAFLRGGEVLRCGILKRYEKIPFIQSFGTVIAERAIDVFLLLIVFILSAWLEYERMHTYISENIVSPLKNKFHSLAENKTTLLLLTGIFVIALILLFIFRKKIFKNSVAKKISTLLLNFWEGIRTVAKVKNPLLFIFHSIFIWAMYLMSVYVCVFAFSETRVLTLADCLTIMAFGSLGVIASPGGIGAYQIIVQTLLPLLYLSFRDANGDPTSAAVAFGWIVWLAQTAVVLLVGLLSFGLLAIGNKESPLSSSPQRGES